MIFKLKRNDKIGLFFFIAFIIGMSLTYLFEERFNETQWKTNPMQRHKMVDDLIESQLLIEKTKNEVITILGEPNLSSNTDKDLFIYKIGNPPSFFDSRKEHLLIVFEDQNVEKVTLAYE